MHPRFHRTIALTMLGIASIAFFQQFQTIAAQSPFDSSRWKQDSSIDSLEEKVRSTLLYGGSSPVGFSGEVRNKIQFHSMLECPPFMRKDRSWLQSGWEGNQALLRLGMIVSLGRNVTVYSKLGLQNTLPGNYRNDTAGSGTQTTDPGFIPCYMEHDKTNAPAYIHEDMLAGIALRTPPASFMLRFGGIQWIEASPFTIWEYQRRMFAWDYLPYEIEEPIATYYDKNLTKGERTGRAAWNKKPFNGIGLESIDLPRDFQLGLFYGCIEPFDRHEREYIDLQGNLAFYSVYPPTAAKGNGIGDSYRHAIHGRLAKMNTLRNLTAGVNVISIVYDPDITSNTQYQSNFAMASGADNRSFYKEPLVISADLRGKVTDGVELLFDAAIGRVDTSYFLHDNISHDGLYAVRKKERRPSPIAPALFAGIRSSLLFPAGLELICVAPGFYSPFSFAKAVDAFSPFGANLVGPGNYVSSAYNQNLAGCNLHLSPPGWERNGHCKITYGIHGQIARGPDALFFPYRLNGADLYGVFQTSCTRWGLDLLDYSIVNPKPGWSYYTTAGAYQKRIGDESYRRPVYGYPYGPEAGGMRSLPLEIFEGFVPYETAAGAQANLDDTTATVFKRSSTVPSHRKYTFNIEFDASRDIAAWLGWTDGVLLSCYAAVNGVSKGLTPVAVNEKSRDMLLWGAMLRFEPAVSISDNLYVLGLAGFENWRSDKAWMADSAGVVHHTPMDFRDAALGIGVDWRMLERVGFHGRCKWMRHTDRAYSANNWKTPVVSAEIKMWF